jgi:hypothetical protein
LNPTLHREDPVTPVPVPPKDLKNLKKYVANLKKWLKREHQWQRTVYVEVNKIRRHVGLPGGPAPLKPPPPPPFNP